MKTQRKAIVAGLAAVLSLGVASGVAWAQDTQKLDNQTQGQIQGKGSAGAEMKSQGSSQMKGDTTSSTKADAGASTKAEGGTKLKKGDNAEMKAESKADTSAEKKNNKNASTKSNKNQMKAEEGSSKKQNGSKAEMKSETNTTNKAASDNNNAGASNEKTGSVRKNAGTNVNITTKQKTEIRQVIKTKNVEPVEHVTFDVDVGTSIPHSVHLYALPPRIVKIVPEYESYEYFVLADGRIVIVDPDTYEIVYIIA